jgi:hypothetical protein
VPATLIATKQQLLSEPTRLEPVGDPTDDGSHRSQSVTAGRGRGSHRRGAAPNAASDAPDGAASCRRSA